MTLCCAVCIFISKIFPCLCTHIDKLRLIYINLMVLRSELCNKLPIIALRYLKDKFKAKISCNFSFNIRQDFIRIQSVVLGQREWTNQGLN